jgi:hypothetical protein
VQYDSDCERLEDIIEHLIKLEEWLFIVALFLHITNKNYKGLILNISVLN